MSQAVMLAGGRGTRLAPHTDFLPKALVDVAGKPFLEHLLDGLARQGITELLILAGYRSSQLVDAAGNLTHPVRISVLEGDPEWSTGERLLHSRHLLQPRFLLVYSDNLTVFRLDQLSHIQESTQAKIVFSACLSHRGNLVRDVEGSPHVVSYLPDRSKGQASWVEVGFSFVDRDYLLTLLESTGGSLPEALAKAARDGAVTADFLPYPYHSIGDPERLEKTVQTLRPRRILLIDRDGIVNARPPRACYIGRPEEITFIATNVEALASLGAEGFKFIIITNQAGIGRGSLTADDVKGVNDFVIAQLADAGVDVIALYQCPHSWDAGCTCRKPQPGMLTHAAREHDLYLPKTVFVGDDERDVEAGNAAGTQTILIGEESGITAQPSLGVFPDLQAALPSLRAAYNTI